MSVIEETKKKFSAVLSNLEEENRVNDSFVNFVESTRELRTAFIQERMKTSKKPQAEVADEWEKKVLHQSNRNRMQNVFASHHINFHLFFNGFDGFVQTTPVGSNIPTTVTINTFIMREKRRNEERRIDELDAEEKHQIDVARICALFRGDRRYTHMGISRETATMDDELLESVEIDLNEQLTLMP